MSTTSGSDSPHEKHVAKIDTVPVSPAGIEGEVALERNFSFLSSLGLAFALLNSWTAMSASLGLVLPSGGSVAMIWGLVVSALGTLAMGVSLAEICHVYPMTGGQYDWAYILAPEWGKRPISFFVGWMAVGGWTSMSAAAWAFISNFIFGILALWKPEFEMQQWQWFLLYLGLSLLPFILNALFVRALPAFDRAGGVWAFIGIVAVSITILACSSGKFQDAKFVFATFYNETGWPDGLAFLLGLLQSTFGLTGFDAVTHLIEEMPRPSRNAPRAMVMAIIMGASTSFVFMIILLLCIRDYDAVVASATGPILQIYYQATSSQAGATCLVLFNMGGMFFSGQAIMTVCSRMILTFSRDGGLGHFSRFLAPVHPKLKVPLWSLVFVLFWILVFGLIELGSDVVLNAILSSSVVMLQMSYGFPILLSLLRGEAAYLTSEGKPAVHRTWSLGKFRFIINLWALVFLVVTSIIFLFPPATPVSGSSMNYVIAVVGVVWAFAGVTWLVHARTHFHGPSQLKERLAIALAA